MAKKREPVKEPRYCPYCDTEIAEATFPYCGACQVPVFYCPKCREVVPRDKKVCPHCGADIREKSNNGG
jgi:Zn-finger nucleic acid-binding protein